MSNTCYLNETVIPLKEKELASETFEILCSNFELDIDSQQITQIPSAPLVDERKYSGTVKFSAEADTRPPSLESEGTLRLTGSGSAPDCAWTHQGTVDVSVSGETLIEGDQEPRL